MLQFTFNTEVIDLINFQKNKKVYKDLLTSSMILEESSVASDLILFIKINAFTWHEVWRREREQKSKSTKKRDDARGWDDTDACLSRVGNKFGGSCLAHSFPMAQCAGLIIDRRTMASEVHFLFCLFYLFLQFPHSDLLSWSYNRRKILQLLAKEQRNSFKCRGCWINLSGVLTGASLLWPRSVEIFSVWITVYFALWRDEAASHLAEVTDQPLRCHHVCHLGQLLLCNWLFWKC